MKPPIAYIARRVGLRRAGNPLYLFPLLVLLALFACAPRTVPPAPEGAGRPGDRLEKMWSSNQGLSGRGVQYPAPLQDSSSKTGIVVVQLCVNRKGEVISAAYTLKGSTTSDEHLIQLAVDNARQWRFAKSREKKQCGTITYNFRNR